MLNNQSRSRHNRPAARACTKISRRRRLAVGRSARNSRGVPSCGVATPTASNCPSRQWGRRAKGVRTPAAALPASKQASSKQPAANEAHAARRTCVHRLGLGIPSARTAGRATRVGRWPAAPQRRRAKWLLRFLLAARAAVEPLPLGGAGARDAFWPSGGFSVLCKASLNLPRSPSAPGVPLQAAFSCPTSPRGR